MWSAMWGGLALIGVIALVLHGVVNNLLREEQATSLILARAAILQGEAQRVHALIREAEGLTDGPSRKTLALEIHRSADSMAEAHEALLHSRDHDGDSQPIIETVDTIYFGAPTYLDERIRLYIGAARDAARVLGGSGSVRPFLNIIFREARSELSDSLGVLVKALSKDNSRRITVLRQSQMAAVGVFILTLLAEALFIFRPMIRTLLAQRRELYEMARTDPLTGSHNRRAFLSLAEEAIAEQRRAGHPLSLLALDIDHFKRVNDTWGHGVGDLIIRRLAQTGLDTLPPTTHFGRLGGEEFAAILPATPLNVAESLAESLRKHFKTDPPVHDGEPVVCTVSIGVAELADVDRDMLDLLARADAALYEAKDRGRDRVVVDHQPAAQTTEDAPPA